MRSSRGVPYGAPTQVVRDCARRIGPGYDEQVDDAPAADDPDGDAARLEAELTAALERAKSDPDRVTAFRRVTRLTEIWRQATIAGGEARAALAKEIRETGQLSLAVLADKIGISKPRAQDLAGKRKDKR